MLGDKIILLLSLSLVCSSVLIGCPTTTCSYSIKKKCYAASHVGNTYTASVFACDSTSICEASIIPVSSNYSRSCEENTPYIHYYVYPGGYCEDNSQCTTELCISNACVGLSKGSSCYGDHTCGAGLYCMDFGSDHDGTCTSLIEAGKACEIYQTCIYGYDCLEGVCTKLFNSFVVGASCTY